MTKLRCKICGSEVKVLPDGTWEQTFPQGKSPYGGNYEHLSTFDCVFHQGKTVEELKQEETIEVLEE